MNKWRKHTSQKLYLASLQLKLWQEYISDESHSFKPQEESFRQSAILLLNAAWDSLVNELADYHQRPTGVSMSLDSLVGDIGDELPEIGYLTELSSIQGSWLSDLRKVNRAISEPGRDEPANEEQAQAFNALIVTSGAAESIDSLTNLERVLAEFKMYLEELRSRMAEW